MFQISNGNKGISVVEILVAIAILLIISTSLLGLINFSLRAVSLTKQTTKANTLAQEAMEAVRNFRDQTSWEDNGLGNLTAGVAYHPQKTADLPPKWVLVSGEETIDIFTRKVVFETVYRDENDDIAQFGAEDPDTQKATVTVSWTERGKAHQLVLVTYFTNWK
ncbi:MAG: hypothetical protein Q8N73_01680 [bacterium]|nr:hypothetical protein [bacterium]